MPSAVGAAAYLAKLANGRPRVLASRGVHPHSRETLTTLARGYGQTVEEVPLRDGATDLDALVAVLGDDVCAVVLQQPNFLGAVEDVAALTEAAKAVGAVVVCACDPLPLGVLEPPGAQGVDIAVGEGQSLGNRLDYGGPSFFPLLVEEALLIEPTETETKETVERFAEIIATILHEAAQNPEIARNAPYSTPVRRLDEARAAKAPVLRQSL